MIRKEVSEENGGILLLISMFCFFLLLELAIFFKEEFYLN